MMTHLLIRSLAVLLMTALIAPSVFLIAPHHAYAIFATTVELPGPLLTAATKTSWETTIGVIKETLTSVHTFTSAVANEALVFNAYVLQPLAFIMSGNLLKMLTASVISFVVGAANGTGAPQFVQDLNGNLQRVGDIQANAFFVQFGRNSNSPFASAISSSLRTNYLWNTSSAGFFAANRNTMARYSPNPNAFLNGDWSQGGVGAWFALTTQNQNNPYTFYQASQSHLASVVGSAQAARRASLDWGQGFLSWCGVATDAVSPDAERQIFDDGSTLTTDSTGGMTATNAVGINPGDPCLNKDGNSGTIKTPGSTIKAILDKVLGSTQDKLVQLGQLANEVGGILGNVATVFQTVNLASQILGGPDGGLYGSGQTSASRPTSRIVQYQNTPTLGVTQSTVLKNASTLPMSGSDMLSRVNQYESYWNTIRSAANSASSALVSLSNFCNAAATNAKNSGFASSASAQATAAINAITTQISPIIAQANSASTVISNARSAVQTLQNQLNSRTSGSVETYTIGIQALQSMPPTTLDVANMQQETQRFGTSNVNSTESLNVSGGSMIDRLNLIISNAETLKTSVCTESLQNNNRDGRGGDD